MPAVAFLDPQNAPESLAAEVRLRSHWRAYSAAQTLAGFEGHHVFPGRQKPSRRHRLCHVA